MKRIKVAQVITRMDWGGSSDIVRIICQSLDKEKYDLKLITGLSKQLTLKNKKFLEEFRDNIIKVPYLKRNINPFWDFLALFNLYLIFKKEKFNLVHTHTAKAGFLGRLSAYFAGIRKIIYMPHGHIFYGYFKPIINRLVLFLERFAAKFTSKIMVLTELEKKDFLSLKIKKSEDIEVIPSGLEMEEFVKVSQEKKENLRRKLNLVSGKKFVGMVSRLEKVKGGEYFIEAAFWILKKRQDVKFLVAGQGSFLPTLKRKAKELGIEREVLFLGWQDNILEIISLLDILVQPSLNEAVGRVLLEAQALGIPVVATKVGGIPEVVKDNLTGILVPSKDSKEIAKAILILLDDEEKRLRFSQEAKRWVDERFSSANMVKRIELLYEEMLKEHK